MAGNNISLLTVLKILSFVCKKIGRSLIEDHRLWILAQYPQAEIFQTYLP